MPIQLVSGLAIEIRPLKGSEIRAVADPQLLRTGGSVDVMLKACLLEIVDPGPYAWLSAGGRLDWDRVLSGDRFDALLATRVATFGPDYYMRVQCTGPRCKESYEWELNLGDLPRRALKASSREMIASGKNRLTTTAPDGHEVHYKLNVGGDEKTAAKLRKQAGNAWSQVDALALAILEVEGIGTARNKVIDWIEGMAWPDVMELFQTIEDSNCGVDTKIETYCPHCGWQQEIQMPFDAGFFNPKRRKPTTEGQKEPTTKTAPTETATETETSSEAAQAASSSTSSGAVAPGASTRAGVAGSTSASRQVVTGSGSRTGT
jgi:hypothetical protein